MDPWITMSLIVLALFALGLVVLLSRALLLGAVFLFALAGQQGFIGVAVYAACWVFLLPLMLVACIVAGLCLAAAV